MQYILTVLRRGDELQALADNIIRRRTSSSVSAQYSDVALIWFQWPLMRAVVVVLGNRGLENKRTTRWWCAGAWSVITRPQKGIGVIVVNATRGLALVL
jgi:hypothetical protein